MEHPITVEGDTLKEKFQSFYNELQNRHVFYCNRKNSDLKYCPVSLIVPPRIKELFEGYGCKWTIEVDEYMSPGSVQMTLHDDYEDYMIHVENWPFFQDALKDGHHH